MSHFNIRPAAFGDHAAFSSLLSRSYPRLLAPCYSRAVLAQAVPVMTLTPPEVLAGGRYFLAEDGVRILAAGGWSDIGHL